MKKNKKNPSIKTNKIIKVKHVLPPGAKKPMAQSAQIPPVRALPNCPAAHPVHSVFLVPFAAGHAKHLILGEERIINFSLKYLASGQSVHEIAPAVAVNVPASQDLQWV